MIQVNNKIKKAWVFYDWANSVYSLVISSSIFPIFYGALFTQAKLNSIYLFNIPIKSSALIVLASSLSFLIVVILSPFLSGISDYIQNKKIFMKFFCYMGAFSCISLYWFSLENILISIVFYALALIGYTGSIVFYNSYLPDIADKKEHDSLSAKGYAWGYMGSVILLIINLVIILNPELLGLPNSIAAMRWSFVMVGLWWFLFSQYTFAYLPKGKREIINDISKKKKKEIILGGYVEIKKVYSSLINMLELRSFLRVFFFYSIGVQTVMLVSIYFGEQEIAWNDSDHKTLGLISSILIIQIIATVGAILTARVSKKIGNIKTLMLLNILWAIVCVYAFFIKLPIQFYIAASLVGFIMGGIQSLSRSTYSKMLPKEAKDTASFFSFFDVTEKLGIVIGTAIYGFIDQITGSMRNAILFLVIIFIISIFLLHKMTKQKYGQ